MPLTVDRSSPCSRAASQLDDRLFPLAHHDEIGLRGGHAEFGHRGDMLTPDDDEHPGVSGLDAGDQRHHSGPFVGEDRRDPDHGRIRRDSSDDLLEAQPDQVAP